MLTAALDGLVERAGLAGERLGEVAAGAVLKHSRDFNLTRESRARHAGSRPRRPPTTSARPAAPGWRRRSSSPTRSRSARSTRRSPAASTRPPTRRSRSTTTCARSCSRPTARARTPTGSRALRKVRPGHDRSRDPAQRRAAHRPLDGRAHARSWPASGGSPARRRTSSPRPATSNLAAAYDARLRGRPRHAVPRPRARPEPAARLDASRSSAKLKPVFGGEDGHDDRRQLDAAHRRRLGGAARRARSGPRSTACRSLARFVDAETAAVDHVSGSEGLLMAPAYAVPRMLARNGLDAPGLRPLRDPRGVRRPGALHAGGLGGPGLLQASASASTSRSARSTATSSTSTAARSPPATRSPRPAAGSSAAWRSCCTSAAAAAG